MKRNFFLWGGLFFAFWAIFNTAYSLLHYGVDQGVYLWLTNLALIGTAYGLLRRDKEVLTHFLAVTSFTQVFWIIDNLYRLVRGKNLFGLVEFMYQPGTSFTEFCLAHHHFFTPPILILAICNLKDRKPRFFFLAPLIYLAVFAASYLSPVDQNVNCTHMPCFPVFVRWEGLRYTIVFFLIILTMGLCLQQLFSWLFRDERATPLFQKRVRVGAISVMALFLVASIADIFYRNTLPHFTCDKVYEDSVVKIGCKYTMDYTPDWLMLIYTVKNKTKKAQDCIAYYETGEKKEVLQNALFILAAKTTDLSILIRYPKKDVNAKISAVCKQAFK